MYWSSISRLVVFIDVVVPLTVKSPPIIVSFVIDKAPNVTESVCCNPKSTVEPTTPFVVSLTSPCPGDAIEEPDIIFDNPFDEEPVIIIDEIDIILDDPIDEEPVIIDDPIIIDEPDIILDDPMDLDEDPIFIPEPETPDISDLPEIPIEEPIDEPVVEPVVEFNKSLIYIIIALSASFLSGMII